MRCYLITFIKIYVYIFVYIYARAHRDIRVHTCVCVSVFIYVCMYVYRWVCIVTRFGTICSFFLLTIASLRLRTKSYNLSESSSLGSETRKFVHSSIRSNTQPPPLTVVVYIIILYMYRSELYLFLKTTHNATHFALRQSSQCRSRKTRFFFIS